MTVPETDYHHNNLPELQEIVAQLKFAEVWLQARHDREQTIMTKECGELEDVG